MSLLLVTPYAAIAGRSSGVAGRRSTCDILTRGVPRVGGICVNSEVTFERQTIEWMRNGRMNIFSMKRRGACQALFTRHKTHIE